MVSIRTWVLLLTASTILCAGGVNKGATLFQVSLGASHSPQHSTFYRQTMDALRFHFYEKETSYSTDAFFCRNTSVIVPITIQLAWHHFRFSEVSAFTPLFTSTLSYKRLMYLSYYSSPWIDDYYMDMRNFRMLLGFGADFSFQGTESAYGNYNLFSVRPTASLGQSFHGGHLGTLRASLFQTTVELRFEHLRGGISKKRKGFSVALIPSFEKQIGGDSEYGYVYGYTVDKTVKYPDVAWGIGLSFGYTLRREPVVIDGK